MIKDAIANNRKRRRFPSSEEGSDGLNIGTWFPSSSSCESYGVPFGDKFFSMSLNALT